MHIHYCISHNGIKGSYRMEILRNYKSAFERQSNEPVRINLAKRSKHIININSKNEWHSQQIERLKVVPIGGDSINESVLNIIPEETISQRQGDKRKPGRPKGSKNIKNIRKT